MLDAGRDMTVVDTVGIIPLESEHRRHGHLRIDVSVLAVTLPHARPARIAPQIHDRGKGPRYRTCPGLISRNFGASAHESAIERRPHIDALRKEGRPLRIGCAVNLVYPIDTGNPQFVERTLLDAIDKPGPHLTGLPHAEGNIQDRPNLIAADHRIEQRLAQHRVLRVALVDHHPGRQLAHLPDLLFEGHLLEQLPDAGFYLFIGRYGRGYPGTCGQSAQQAQKQNRNFFHFYF